MREKNKESKEMRFFAYVAEKPDFWLLHCSF